MGITEHPPWTERAAAEPAGVEADLVRAFAGEIGAQVRRVWGAEQRLFERLEEHELDLVVGGITDASPWIKKVGFTKPYLELDHGVHEGERRVMAVAPGENGFLRRLEVFLRGQRGELAVRAEKVR